MNHCPPVIAEFMAHLTGDAEQIHPDVTRKVFTTALQKVILIVFTIQCILVLSVILISIVSNLFARLHSDAL